MDDSLKSKYVPIWKKYSLSIQEAAEYYGIGEKRIRQIAAENPNADLFWKWDRISGLKENSSKNIWMNLQWCRFCRGK